MSYGRSPHYIYNDGENVYFDDVAVPVEAVAQFVSRMLMRGNNAPGGVEKWLKLGKNIRPDQPDIKVTIELDGPVNES